ncbi:MAG: hypothetical protein ACLUPL_09030 [Butyricimonas virosa]
MIEIVLHSIYEENPDVFKKENERRWFETGVNTAVMAVGGDCRTLKWQSCCTRNESSGGNEFAGRIE